MRNAIIFSGGLNYQWIQRINSGRRASLFLRKTNASTDFSQNEHDSNKQRFNRFEEYGGSYDFSYGESSDGNV